ncbi:unnamed protein product [Symbiodinium sp. CCMP2456]|nr:unnamed protein product [Symbiodinium sp. CCMP2456]
MAPYGAPVHIKQKAFDSSGPRRRERAFESKWLRGHYMGLSNLLDDGHVIYVPGTEDSKEKFIHTFHDHQSNSCSLVKNLSPGGRSQKKTPAAEVEMRALDFTREDLEEYAAQRSKALLDKWDYHEALRLVDELAEAKFFEDRTFGVWRHGGAVGWTTAFKEFPDVAKALAKLVLELEPEATFTAICVMRNSQRGQHRDSNNDEKANNYLVPVRLPRSGGGLWVELSPGDRVCGQVEERSDDKGTRRYGHVLTFEMGRDPKVCPINVVEEDAYQEDLTPIAGNDQEWDMFLDVEDGMVKGPLEVTHTVDPKDAMAHPPLWKDAIAKEMNTVEVAISRLQVGTPERREWLQNPRAQRLPTKMVFTVKPNSKAELTNRDTWVKRKVRLVVCGNFAASEAMSLYTEAAPSEAVRTGLVIAKREGWSVGIIDIVAAFLKTPIGNDADDPVIIATPPKLLQELNLIQAHELWGLVRALYGLRQSPVLWSRHRDRRMEAMKPPAGFAMSRGRTISSWWSVRDMRGRLSAVILIYVDDYLVLGPKKVIQMLTDMIQEEWDTSDLSILTEDNAVKFLGMELTKRGEEMYLSQQGYIEELIRAYELQPGDHSRIPIAKDDAVYEVLPGDLPPTEQLIHQAQQMTGELLWLSQRSRPDLSFGCCVLSSMSTRAPARVVAMAHKMLKYINYTKTYQLRVNWGGNHMYLYPDAAFAPGAARSQTGWVITYGGTPILWRSSRQSTTALSSAEAELNAILEGSVAMLGVEAMLMDMNEYAEDKIVGSDSMSALSLSAGTGSWRTRHLRIKAAWLQEAISSGVIKSIHVPGVRQPADLLTKALSGERIRALLSIWGMGERKRPSQGGAGTASTAAARALVAMICCIMMVTVDAQPTSGTTATLQVDWDLAGVLMVLLMVLGALLLWEVAKWSAIYVYQEWTPGASARKMRRLRKLRDATSLAIEKEVNRLAEPGEGTGQTRDLRAPSLSESEANRRRRQQPRTPTPPRSTRMLTSPRSMRSPTPPRSTRTEPQEQVLTAWRPHMDHPSRPTRTDAHEQVLTAWRPYMTQRPSTPPIPQQREGDQSQQPTARTPSPRQPTRVMSSPGERWSEMSDSTIHSEELERICMDVIMLMRCEEIKQALRQRSLPSSGLKEDIARRLSLELVGRVRENNGPTVRQLKYLLWLWRSRDLSGKTLLVWDQLQERSHASHTIHRWKSL